MEMNRSITVELKITRRQAYFALVLLFLSWHPGFLGSETLTLTTYYPAPYGGYVSILTTGNTILARDIANSTVSIGANSGNTAAVKLNVNGAIQVGNFALLKTDQDGSIELGQSGSGDVPYIDFHGAGDGAADYSARLILDRKNELEVDGSLRIKGSLNEVCVQVGYGVGGYTGCPAGNPTLIGTYGTSGGSGYFLMPGRLGVDGADSGGGFTGYWEEVSPINNNLYWTPVGEDWSGTMTCCRLGI